MRRSLDRFLSQTADPRAVQQSVLRELVALNADSDFGREHKFHEIRGVADLRQRVPVSVYDDFRPYIERVKRGDTGALLGSHNKLLMFALTSGTTAESKYLPITRRFLEDYRRGWQMWSIRAFDDHPAMMLQEIVQLASDHDQFRSVGGHPCGNISGLVAAMQNPLVRTLYAIPTAAVKIKSPEAKYYTAMRFALANRLVGMVFTANPSTVIHLAKLADLHKQEIIRDIFDGTLSSRFEIAEDVRGAIGRGRLRRDPKRARELERMAERTGKLIPRDYWPDLSLLAVWTGGSAGAYLRGLKPFFGDVPIRDHGLSASEGRMTIPLLDGRADGILDIASHFFEFIPETEYGKSNPIVLEAHELEEGTNYYILLTTASGLCRYDIHDVVRCTGFWNGTPLLEFLNKGSNISSLTGEKISESQVVAAVREAVAEGDLNVACFTLAPVWGDPPGYRLLVESQDVPSSEAGERLAARTDAILKSLNSEYDEKRLSGRLAPLTHFPIPTGTWARFSRQRQARLGGSVEQYKHPCLVPDLAFYDTFLNEFARAEADAAIT